MLNKKWQARVSWSCCILIGLVFIVAAVTKFNYAALLTRDMMAVFGIKYASTDNATYLFFSMLARLLVATELWLGFGMFQAHWRRRLLLPGVALMLAVFSIYLAKLAFIDRVTGNCGCFGDIFPMGPLPSLIKNMILLLMTGTAWKLSAGPPARRWWVPAGLSVVALIIVFAFMPIRSRPTGFAGFQNFQGAPQGLLLQGTRMLAFLSLDCEHCEELAVKLTDMELANDELFIVFLGGDNRVEPFSIKTGLRHPWMIPDNPEDFFQHVGDEPPSLYLLRDGSIVRRWDFNEMDADTIYEAWAYAR